MRTLTILTQDIRHRQNLEELGLHTSTVERGLYMTKCPRQKFDIEAFVTLLERIVISDHPVYGNSPKLADMALELKATEIHQLNMAELAAYLVTNNILHLEGYATFRMADYRHRLDVMMYCVIKKMKLTGNL